MDYAKIRWNKDGLIPAIAQDVKTGEVLMLAYMNEESLRLTLETGKATYFSRSRQKLWVKGETSGHTQTLKSLWLDCDGDTVLMEVEQEGAACHTGNKTCFFTPVTESQEMFGPLCLSQEFETILDRRAHPAEGSYTNYLFDKGVDKICKKVGEESAEVIIGAKNRNPEEVSYEAADLLYHLMVLLAEQDMTLEDVYAQIGKRRK